VLEQSKRACKCKNNQKDVTSLQESSKLQNHYN